MTKAKRKFTLNKSSIIEYIFYFLCFLFGLDFLGFTRGLFLILVSVFLIYKFFSLRMRIGKTFLLVLLFSFFLTLFDCINSGFGFRSVLYHFVLPIISYLFGYNLCTNREYSESGEKIYKTLLSIFIGFSLYSFIGAIVTAYSFGFFPYERRFMYVWSTSFQEISVTNIQYQIIPITCIAPVIIFFKSPYKKLTHVIIAVLAFAFSLYLGFVLQCRTYVLCVILVVALFPFLLIQKDSKRSSIISAVYLVFLFIILFGGYFLLAYSKSFQDFVLSVPLFRRIFSSAFNSDNQRFGLWTYFFKYFYKYPFGGFPMIDNPLDELAVSHYFHNYWLDIYRVGGFAPFLLMLFFTGKIISNLFKIRKNIKDKFVFKFIIMSLLGLFVFAMFEPIYQMNVYFSMLVFIMFGITERLYFNVMSRFPFSKKLSFINRTDYKIVYISNFLSLHAIGIHNEFVKKYGERYHYIALDDLNSDHKKYDYDSNAKNVLYYFKENQKEECERLLREADVIIGGCVSTLFISKFLNKKKLYITCSERIYKKSFLERWSIKSIFSYFKNFFLLDLKTNNIALSLSGYTAFDLDQIDFCANQTYEWAYLTKPLSEKTIDCIVGSVVQIVFVNRFIEWKHPETVLKLASYLKKHDYKFMIHIIGDGILYEKIKEEIKTNELNDCVTLHGLLENDTVNRILLNSDILVSCSNREEGWGATINEGLCNGCAVVASHLCGAAPVLIKNGINGFVYNYHDEVDLFKKIGYLIDNKSDLEMMKYNALIDMKSNRTPDIYCNRFDTLICSILDGRIYDFNHGPLSKQQPVSEIEIQNSLKTIKYSTKSLPSKEKNNLIGKKTLGLKAGTIISYFTIMFTIATGFLFTPWLLNVLGESNYAIYALATSLISMFTIDFGLGAAVSRFISKYRAEKDIDSSNKIIGLIFKAFLIVDGAIFTVLLVLFFFLQNMYPSLTSNEISVFKIVFIMAGIYSLISFEFTPLNGILMGNSRFPQYKIITLISKIVYFVFALIALKINANLYIYVLVVAGSGLFEILIKLLYIKKSCKYGSSPIFKRNNSKSILLPLIKYSIWAAVAGLCSRFILTINQNILGIFAGTLQITFFAVGCQIEGYVWQFSNALDGMFMPILSKMDAKKSSGDDFTNMMIKVGRIQLLLIGLVLIGFICLGNNFINTIWMSKENISYTSSYWVAVFLVLPAFFTYTHQIGKSTLLVKGKNKYYAFGMIISATLSTALGFLFCGLFPKNAAVLSAAGICIAKFLGLVIYMSYAYKKHADINIFKFYLKCHLRYLPILVSIMLLGFVVDWLIPSTLLFFVIKVLIITIAYIIASWHIYMNNGEKQMARLMLQKISLLVDRIERNRPVSSHNLISNQSKKYAEIII